jgi:hypothetical protein
LNVRRFLPYITGLVILAFALGSLPRGSPRGSLLFESTWLLYLVYLGPVVILGLMVALVIFIALNWRDIGAALGISIAQKRMMKKKRSRYSFFLSLVLWAIAIEVLLNKPGSIFNPIRTNSTILVQDITNQGGNSPNPFLGGSFLPAVSSIVQNDWFTLAFLGLLVVGGLVLVQSIRVSLKETSELKIEDLRARQLEGLQAARDALKLIDDEKAGDARSRIITCYQHMVEAVSTLGVHVSSDQTARELEEAIRSTFVLKGTATGDLTQLFEEARYSLHEIIDEHAVHAHDYLESIAEELKIQLDN